MNLFNCLILSTLLQTLDVTKQVKVKDTEQRAAEKVKSDKQGTPSKCITLKKVIFSLTLTCQCISVFDDFCCKKTVFSCV